MIFNQNFTFKSQSSAQPRLTSPITLPTSVGRITKSSLDVLPTHMLKGQQPKGTTRIRNSVVASQANIDIKATTGSRISVSFENEELTLTFSSLNLNLDFDEAFQDAKRLPTDPRRHQSKSSIGYPSIERTPVPALPPRHITSRPATPVIPKTSSLSKKFTMKRSSPLPMVSRESFRRLRTGFSNSGLNTATTTAGTPSQPSFMTTSSLFKRKHKKDEEKIPEAPLASFLAKGKKDSNTMTQNTSMNAVGLAIPSRMQAITESDEFRGLSYIRLSSDTSSIIVSDVNEIIAPESLYESGFETTFMDIRQWSNTQRGQSGQTMSEAISAFPLPPQRPPVSIQIGVDSPKLEAKSDTSSPHQRKFSESDIPWKAPSFCGRLSHESDKLSSSHTMESLLSSEVVVTEGTPKSTGEDLFDTFSAMTKPRSNSTDTSSKMARRQKREYEFAKQMQHGAYFSTSDDESDSDFDEEDCDLQDDSDNLFWTMSEDDYEDDGRWQLPPLSPDLSASHRNSIVSHSSSVTSLSIATPTTPSYTELEYYYPTNDLSTLDKRHHRRRTASSECLLVENPEDLKCMSYKKLTEAVIEEECSSEDCIDHTLVFTIKKGKDYHTGVRIVTEYADNSYSH